MLQPNLGQQIQVYVQFTGNEKSSPTISQQEIFDLDLIKMKMDTTFVISSKKPVSTIMKIFRTTKTTFEKLKYLLLKHSYYCSQGY